MSAWWALIEREIVERWRVLPAALMVGLLPLVVEYLPVGQRLDPGDLRDTTAFALTLLFTLGVAVVCGSTMMARELNEGRLGFYFSRPMSATSLWSGKLTAAVGLAAISGLLVVLPAWIAGSEPHRHLENLASWLSGFHAYPVWLSAMADGPVDAWWTYRHREAHAKIGVWSAGGLVFCGLVLVVLLCHFVAIALRSRSLWLLFDFVLGGGLLAGVGALVFRLQNDLAAPALGRGMIVALIGLPLMACCAGLAQQHWGRTVPRRAHGAFSSTFWGLAALGIAMFYAWVWRSENAGPKALSEVAHLRFAPQGEWSILAGELSTETGHKPTFALGPGGTPVQRLPVMPRLDTWPRFSANGQRLAWIECSRRYVQRCPVWLWGLDPNHPPREVTSVRSGSSLALSASGRYLATLERLELEVYDTEADRLVLTHRLSKPRLEGWLRFEDEGRPELLILVRENDRPRVEIWGLDATGETLERRLEIPGFKVVLSEDWQRVGVLARQHLDVIDRANPDNNYRLPVQSLRIARARFLSQGRLALAEGGTEADPPQVTVLGPDGTLLHTLAEGVGLWYLGGEPQPGTLLIGHKTPRDDAVPGTGRFVHTHHHWKARWVDLETGETLGVFPGRYPSTWRSAPGSAESRLLMTTDGMVEALDPDTGQLLPIRLDNPQQTWVP